MTPAEAAFEAGAIDGWMTETELVWLAEQASTRRVVIEVGVWKGRSTTALCLACPGTVIAIDHFQGSPHNVWHGGQVWQMQELAQRGNVMEQAVHNLERFIVEGKLILLPMSSVAASFALHSLRKPFADMLFIDGDHSEKAVRHDLDLLSDLVFDDGLICGHDASEPGVAGAIAELSTKVIDGGDIWYVESNAS